ncbi:MAG: hypothetical protein WBN16_07185 [Lutimonas sp.]
MKTIKIIYKTTLLFIFATTILSCNNKPKSDTKKNSKVMLKLFNINTSNQLIVNVPESHKEQCIINELIKVDSLGYAKGTRTNEETGEKITVIFDYNNIVTINHSDKSVFRFISPFTVSGSGSGNFKYIGLFELNKKTNNINHSDTRFIGDRIVLEKLDYDGNETLDVIIKTHGKEQSFSETPKVTKILKFNITNIINKKE